VAAASLCHLAPDLPWPHGGAQELWSSGGVADEEETKGTKEASTSGTPAMRCVGVQRRDAWEAGGESRGREAGSRRCGRAARGRRRETREAGGPPARARESGRQLAASERLGAGTHLFVNTKGVSGKNGLYYRSPTFSGRREYIYYYLHFKE
jgi:hypothetical protein